MFHEVFEKDSLLPGNLRKAPKINAKTLHPGNNKQSVPLALNIFHETTISAIKSYFTNESAAAEFLNLINSWWVISNSKDKYNKNNRLGHAPVAGDGKPSFFLAFAEWLKTWKEMQISHCTKFSLSAQTFDAFITTLKGTACC